MNKENGNHQNVQLHLETLFQASETEIIAPEELKEEVFGTLETLELVADIVDLFTVKFVQSNLAPFSFVEKKE